MFCEFLNWTKLLAKRIAEILAGFTNVITKITEGIGKCLNCILCLERILVKAIESLTTKCIDKIDNRLECSFKTFKRLLELVCNLCARIIGLYVIVTLLEGIDKILESLIECLNDLLGFIEGVIDPLNGITNRL